MPAISMFIVRVWIFVMPLPSVRMVQCGPPYATVLHDKKLVWHDLRATYGTRLGEAGFNDIAKLSGHANISTSQRYVRNCRFAQVG